MKTLITLVSALIFMSAAVQADDIKKNRKHKNHTVAAAPFAWGDPANDIPAELVSLTIKKLQVPVAPFVWGSSDELPEVVEVAKHKGASVPVAPFILGNPDEEITRDLKVSLAVRGR
ncbi:MAG: hypothetical protein V4721_17185 [Bacteroidota bacterium]